MPYKFNASRKRSGVKKIKRTTWDALEASTPTEMAALINQASADGCFVKDPFVFKGRLVAFIGKTEWLSPEPEPVAAPEPPQEQQS